MWSQFVRQDEADHLGNITCITCGAYLRWQDAHACHFVHCSKQSPLSYRRENIHAGCVSCNVYGHGGSAMIRYTLFMQQTYGPQIVDELLAIKHQKRYLKRADLEAIVEKYT